MEQGATNGGVVNMTRAMEALSPLLSNPRRTIIQVEVLMTVAAGLLFLQFILGNCKRRWHNSIVKGALSVSNVLMFPLIIYTLGLMVSSPIKNSYYPVWIVSLIIPSGGTTAVKQYDFDDSKMWMQFCIETARYGFYLLMLSPLLNTKTPEETWRDIRSMEAWSLSKLNQQYVKTSASTWWLSFYVTAAYFAQITEGLTGFRNRKHLSGRQVAKWTKKHANDHPTHYNPRSMKGYNYLVRYPLPDSDSDSDSDDEASSNSHVITVYQIWNSCSNLDDNHIWKDVCLSFALFEQLKRRYYGWICAEENFPKTKDFVFKGLLLTENDYERAFRIVEVELGFCYDFFFTKYHLVYEMGLINSVSWTTWFIYYLGRITLTFVVGVYAAKNSLVLETPSPIIEVHRTEADYIITLVVLGTVLAVDLLQAACYLASNWFKVSLACMYVKQKSSKTKAFILEKVISFFRRITISAGWSNMIGQYSVIRVDNLRKQYTFSVDNLMKQDPFSVDNLRKQEPVEVSDSLKRAIASSLTSTVSKTGHLSNGETSLMEHGVFEDYSWTLKDNSQAEAMLIWHIATDYCDLALSHHGNNGIQDGRDVAVNLSRYYAYLIVYVPELLPYHVADIREQRTTVMEEVKEILASSELDEWYQKMNRLEETDKEDNPASVFRKGVKLGKQLESIPRRWTVMADFWAETITYIAPSHFTAKQHMRHLENGGEFLTHIWALLSHAGILNLDRDKDQGPKHAQSTAETV